MNLTCIILGAALAAGGSAVCAQEFYPESVPTPRGVPKPLYERVQVAARDGKKLVVHAWTPPNAPAKKPVVLFIHGISMHGEPYASIQAGFTARGLTFWVPDLRGHGRSEGERGELAQPHVLRADIGAVIEAINKRHPGKPVVLAGESMGGLIAADYGWRGEKRLLGLALLAPAFAVHPAQINLSDVGNLFTGRIPVATDEKLQMSSRDKGFIAARKSDKLALPEVKTSYLAAIADLQRKWPGAAAQLKMPVFIAVAGKDRVVDTKTMKRAYDNLGTQNKAWRQWDEAQHTLCWDPQTTQVIEELTKWALDLSEK